MTMFPAHHHHQHHHQHNLSEQKRYSGDGRSTYLASGGGCVYHDYSSTASDQACVGSDLIMAEDESRTTESNNNDAGSSSKEELEKDDGGWLQLSIGGHTNTTATSSSSYHDHLMKLDQTTTSSQAAGGGGGGRLIELDLLPPSNSGGVGGNSRQASFRPFNIVPGPLLRPTIFQLPEFRAAPFPANTRLFLQQHQGTPSSSNSSMFPYHQETNNYMAFRTTPQGNIIPNSLVGGPGSYFARPLHVLHSGGGGGGMDVAGPSLDFRVVEPPRRPQSGVWFMLLASPNQVKEPYLPQIPKSYIRIKDGRMSIRLLIKYLVNKLRLDDESEIEITCRGQQLLPFLTLQHVRDNVWRNSTSSSSSTSPPRRDAAAAAIVSISTLLPHDSSSSTPPDPATTSTDHLMVLHYARIA